ncbi:MAG: HAMP domain-containing histidine kinase [Bacteroidetes bacterium]|nr:HAMP domain-containing histidine kinase [Bacteroidota bacterium]
MSPLIQMNSIRIRMLSGFLFLILLLIATAVASITVLRKTKKIDQINLAINQLQVLTLDLIKSDNDYFDLDLSDENYFKTGHSTLLRQRDSLNFIIQTRVQSIMKASGEINYKVRDKLMHVYRLEKNYTEKFIALEKLSFSRGYKDFGLEGRMREYAHRLERSSLNIYYVLTLRRHEKDFLLRHDTSYLQRFNQLADQLIIQRTRSGDSIVVGHLKMYKQLFNQLAEIEILIGLNSHRGLRNELNSLAFQIGDQFYSLAKYSTQLTNDEQKNINYFYLLTLIGALVFSIGSALWISKRLSEPIAQLSQLMTDPANAYAYARFYKVSPGAATEINALMGSFVKLMLKTEEQLKEIKAKSKLVSYQNDKLKKLNTELDAFLYSTAHDLRSPLASLSGLIRLTEIENQQENLKDYIDRMKKSVARQEDFITQIAGYTKNKKLGLVIEPIQLENLIREIFEAHRYSEQRPVALTIKIHGSNEIYSDRARIQSVFNNLISNAIRYADPEKEISRIDVIVEIGERDIEIIFSDNGIGIEQEHQKRIFEMFYRANYNSKGSGLGLFILKKTVGKLRGKVSIKSAPGIGTTLLITIPNKVKLHPAKSVSQKLLQ